MPRDLIAIGASAGGFTGVLEIVRGLPGDFPAAVFVVIHTSAENPGLLPGILARAGKLPAVHAEHGGTIQRGLIYVARPDHHLFVQGRRICSVRGPKENGFRPAIDPLFRSLARDHGPSVIGVVLSGARDDGAYGLSLIKQAGGLALVQDPDSALVPSMPLSALGATSVDYVLPVDKMARVLIELVANRAHAAKKERPQPVADKTDPELPDTQITDPSKVPGEPTMFTCPECGGTLWELEQGKTLRYRCHVGHRFGAESLVSEKNVAMEAALWQALRTLHEQVALRRRLASRALRAGMMAVAEAYEKQAEDAERRAALIRTVLVKDEAELPDQEDAPKPAEGKGF